MGKVNNKQRGVERYKKLKELEDSGELSFCMNRMALAKAVGYEEDKLSAGYGWVSNMIKQGYLTETILGFSPNGDAMKEYHTTSIKPKYYSEEKRSKRVAKQNIKEVATTHTIETTTLYTMEITRGDITIKLSLPILDNVGDLINGILKGE